MKIVAFGASYSKQSINKCFAGYAARQFNSAETEVLDLNNYELPLFTVDAESEIGVPENARSFLDKLESADLLVISMAEHNGSYTAAFKNLFDWTSRIKANIFEGKKIFLLSVSPGKRGGISALEAARSRFPWHGAEIIGAFSLPYFSENFNPESGIIDQELNNQFKLTISSAQKRLLIK
ncbi:MAG: NAD(P)H-dependent oxidoreductase [Bacteroidales bacterium]|jgi:NAD(P)H-dependent FMN reductase|nr:NAD(P)H-dependent oxidoreductase [Bacteroidales bacterium]